LFPSISKITESNNTDGEGFLITGFSSQQDEFIEFKKPLKTEDSEKINLLSQLNDKIKLAVTLKMSESIQNILNADISLEKFITSCPANLSLPGLQVLWTRSVEERLQKMEDGDIKAMRRYLDEINQDIKIISAFMQTLETGLDKKKLTAAFILIAHFKEIIEQLTYSGVTDKTEYMWDSQLRFYWTGDNLTVKQAFSDLSYGYEFNGTFFTTIFLSHHQKSTTFYFVVCNLRISRAQRIAYL